MPTLTVEDLPPQLYETLARRASEAQRTVSDEVKQILADTLGGPAEVTHDFRLPDLIPSQEISPPCDLPLSGPSTQVAFRSIEPPLPDPIQLDEELVQKGILKASVVRDQVLAQVSLKGTWDSAAAVSSDRDRL